jgi:hypothetical protein
MRPFLLLLLLALAQGCQYDPYAHLYTTEKPQPADVAGHYTLTSQTVTTGGLSVLTGRHCVVELRPDGTFTASNVPPWEIGSPGTNFFNVLLSSSGTWSVGSVGSVDDGRRPLKTHWGVDLNSETAKIRPAGLTGKKPPYGLIFTLGDPDSGTVMILEKARAP